jgi:Homing endonuclease associated repeat
MSKPQILKAIRLSAKKLGRNPSLRDLRLLGGVSEQVIYKRFGGLGRALAAAGLEATGPGFSLPESTLLLDWAARRPQAGQGPQRARV